MARKKKEETEAAEGTPELVLEKPSEVLQEALDEITGEAEEPGVVETVTKAAKKALNTAVERTADVIDVAAGALGLNETGDGKKAAGRRAQKIGVVSSDKMTKTVVVNVDRQVMHPKYRRYVRRRTKFMAHDETGAGIGDKVKIEETRPLSARKRWRVVEIIQKASK